MLSDLFGRLHVINEFSEKVIGSFDWNMAGGSTNRGNYNNLKKFRASSGKFSSSKSFLLYFEWLVNS